MGKGTMNKVVRMAAPVDFSKVLLSVPSQVSIL